MNLTEIVQSSGWKNFMSKLYGLGASIVIIGALFKIQHWSMAGLFLTVGLITESIIFFFSAFEPRHDEVDWSLVYPELAGLDDEADLEGYHKHSLSNTSALEKFDSLIENAEITPKNVHVIGGGATSLIWLQILADTTNVSLLQVEGPLDACARGAAIIS